MKERFKEHIKTKLPFLIEGRLLVAISGGLDSVVLTHLLNQIGGRISLAHCNFNLRGDESDGDEQFVLDLADSLELEVFIQSFDTESYAKKHGLSIQMAARELRYDWFRDLAASLGYDHILTAHHADDNLETFLINLSRGTGLDGLTGIPEQNENIVRPLLPFSRREIEDFAKEHKLKWREDSSNAQTKYLRNALRHELIPKLKELNPQFLQNFGKTQQHLQDSSQLITDRIQEISKGLDLNIISVERIQQLSRPKAYLYGLLKQYGFTEWDDIVGLLDAQSGKQVFSHTHVLLKDREHLILKAREKPRLDKQFTVYERDTSITEPFKMEISTVNKLGGTSKLQLYVDKEKLKFPLTIRKWEKGDYFYPLGMRGKKKLSKFFKDEKYSLFDKEQQWLLCSDHEVVWIVGKRGDDRFKVTDSTKKLVKFKIYQ